MHCVQSTLPVAEIQSWSEHQMMIMQNIEHEGNRTKKIWMSNLLFASYNNTDLNHNEPENIIDLKNDLLHKSTFWLQKPPQCGISI